MNLYDISTDLLKLEQLIDEGSDDEADEAMSEALTEAMASTKENLSDKVMNIVQLLRKQKVEALRHSSDVRLRREAGLD